MRIRKRPLPAYVMPSVGHCQAAAALRPLLSSRPRKILTRSSMERPVSIFDRSFACSLFRAFATRNSVVALNNIPSLSLTLSLTHSSPSSAPFRPSPFPFASLNGCELEFLLPLTFSFGAPPQRRSFKDSLDSYQSENIEKDGR
jgi:hypothetical protein